MESFNNSLHYFLMASKACFLARTFYGSHSESHVSLTSHGKAFNEGDIRIRGDIRCYQLSAPISIGPLGNWY